MFDGQLQGLTSRGRPHIINNYERAAAVVRNHVIRWGFGQTASMR